MGRGGARPVDARRGDDGDPIADAVAGLRSVDDAGDELLAALEAATAATIIRDTPAAASGVAETVAVYHATGSVKAAAKALGLARSTVRARLARAGVVPANDNREATARRAG